MTTEAQKRALRKYYNKIKDRPEIKAAAIARSKKHHSDILKDTVNRKMVNAIKDYMYDHKLKAKSLACLIGCEIQHLYRCTGYNIRVRLEEFKPVPELYETLQKIRGEEV